MDNVECKYHFEKISSSSSFSNIYHQHVFEIYVENVENVDDDDN